jgi:hypothetical protein
LEEKANCRRHRKSAKAYDINGHVCLVRLIRLQTDYFHLFLFNKQTNDKLPLARLANDKQIQENFFGFRFPFETAAYIHTYIYIDIDI